MSDTHRVMSDFSYNINLKTLHYQILRSTIYEKI